VASPSPSLLAIYRACVFACQSIAAYGFLMAQ